MTRISIRDATDPSTPGYRGKIGFAYLIDLPQNSYAYVDTRGAQVPCAANALGGNIDIQCQTQSVGQLVVNGNLWSGSSVPLSALGCGAGGCDHPAGPGLAGADFLVALLAVGQFGYHARKLKPTGYA